MSYFGIILGASSGIGNSCYYEMKQVYPECNFIVIDKQKIDVRKNDIFLQVDLGNKNEILDLLTYIEENVHNISFVVNSIGYQEDIDVLSLKYNDIEKMYITTVFSVFEIEQLIIKKMIKNYIPNQSIVNITSIHSSIIREIAHYSSAKAALTMFSKELAYKVAKYNIRVNCIEPGSIITPLLKKSLYSDELLQEGANNIPMLRHGQPEEVAELACFLISEKSKYISGASIPCDGGLSLII